ncbi:hypothetical protein M408DRAFT_329114 [Serendipita vermifera MAFF 305830]|uniref:Major facilitator superfamily (MFS) profile domain-containing protein n=1 Tax=Serendipita vermifera MAFF 305830 TaxID=933852 RepID=A0A0C3BCI1_SERVB|nr:hypothetical protein M408DRAFT_329114 [Serendipita vermifera MAFF 305830]
MAANAHHHHHTSVAECHSTEDVYTIHSGSTTRANTPVQTGPLDIEKGSLHVSNELSFRTTLFIVIALMVNQFLATSDATIVSTSLPTIVAELRGTQDEYAWVPVAYLLTQTACQPLYGKLADVFGRQAVIYGSTLVFLVGSALCGCAQNMMWLIIARGLSGIGGGGIVNSVWVITTEIVPPGTQAKWSQALSVTWSASAVAGPILGGLFTDQVSWRWAFYINLPIGVSALFFLWYYLRRVHLVRRLSDGSEDTRPPTEVLKHTLKTFDYIGCLLLMGSTSVLVIGTSLAGRNGWTSPETLGLLISGVVGLVLAAIYESHLKENALIPSGILKNLNVINMLVISILHNFAFTAGTYFIPVYYQALHGTSPLVAGMQVLPFSLGAALITIPIAKFISHKPGHDWIDRSLKIVIVSALALAAIGYGLMITLNERSGIAEQELYPLIAGVGIGVLFHTPFQVVTNALPRSDLAQATGAFFLMRFIGTTTGLSVAGAVFSSSWIAYKPEAYVTVTSNPLSIDLRSLVNLTPIELRESVLSAVSASVSSVWIVCTPALAAAFLLSLILRVSHHESQIAPTDTKQEIACSDTPETREKNCSIAIATSLINEPSVAPTLPTLPTIPSIQTAKDSDTDTLDNEKRNQT